MAKKKIERTSLIADQIRQEGGEIKRQDPISRMPMVVSVLDIVAYEKNPRKHTNESYAEIKESIRQKGLEQPFTITRRPGDDKYMTKAGGNTRLQVLQELFQETGDEKFLKVHLVFEPWVSEADTLISHLTENDLRGNLILIDRAQGVREAQNYLEEERGLKLSSRELSAALAQQGYSIGHTALNILIYAIDRLYPFMPEALDAGMGKSVVEKIRKFENQCKEAWSEMAKDPELFDGVFESSLRQADAAEWYFDDLVKIFIENASDATDEKFSIVEFYVHRSMNAKKPPTKEELEAFRQSQDPDYEPTAQSESAESVPLADQAKTEPRPSSPSSDSNVIEDDEDDSSMSNVVPFASDMGDDESDELEADVGHDSEDSEPEEKFSLNNLRAKAIELACEVAKEAHIDDLIIKVDDGFGWILADIPQHIHFPNGFVDTDPVFRKIWTTWFGLFQVSGCSDSSFSKIIANHIPEEKNDLRFLLEGDWEKLSEYGQYISTAAVQTDFFLSTEKLDATFQLIKTHQSIKRLSQALVKPLWTGGSDE